MSLHIATPAIAFAAVLVLPALVAACFAFSCRMLSRLSGWARLGEVYAIGMMPRGRRFAFQSGIVGEVPYILEIHVAPEGIYLRLPFGLNLGHRLLMIPWVDLRHRRKAGRRGKSVRCDVGFGLPVTVELPSMILDRPEQAERQEQWRAVCA